MIKLVILDVDGVMTDGKKYYDRDGNVVMKNFCDKDWTAVKRFRAIGIPVVFLTGDPFNAKILGNRNLPFVVNRGEGFHRDKVNFLDEILEEYKCEAEDVVYLGDDLFDYGIMDVVGHPYSMSDSPAMLQNISVPLACKGGENAIMYLYEDLEELEIIPRVPYDVVMEKIYELDLKEKILMKDISLYGHLTIDTIVDGVKERKTLGSMANVWKALLELDATLDIGLSPIDVGQALIYIDKPAAQRYSKVQLSLVEHQAKIFASKIHHLIYLNELTRTDFIPTLDGIITADICPGRSVNKDLLKHVDYLFISDEDIDGDLSDYTEATKGWVILHSASGSVVSNGEKEFFYKLPEELMLKDVNVLGAGDTFASCFLHKLLQNEGDIHTWIEFAHLKTTEIIRNSI